MEDGLEPSTCAMSGEGARMKDGTQQVGHSLSHECDHTINFLWEAPGKPSHRAAAGILLVVTDIEKVLCYTLVMHAAKWQWNPTIQT